MKIKERLEEENKILMQDNIDLTGDEDTLIGIIINFKAIVIATLKVALLRVRFGCTNAFLYFS